MKLNLNLNLSFIRLKHFSNLNLGLNLRIEFEIETAIYKTKNWFQVQLSDLKIEIELYKIGPSLLLERKADVNGTSPDGDSALHQACQEGHPEMVELLLKYKPRVDTWGFRQSTPLMRAAASSKNALQCVQLLLKHGARANLQCPETGDTALHQATQNSNAEVARALLDAGADMKKLRRGDTLLHLAAQSGCLPILKLALEKGADPNAKGVKGSTPLIRAAVAEEKEAVKMLLENGADVNMGDEDGDTALDLAAQTGNSEIITLMLAGLKD